jgi:hypothetical protein
MHGEIVRIVSYQDGYVNFSTWFTKNVLFEQKKIKLWSKWQVVEDKSAYVYVNIFHIHALEEYLHLRSEPANAHW